MNENPETDKETSAEWTMPEPVFRSSEGVSPKERVSAEEAESAPQDEIPTETMGFVKDEKTSADASKQSVRVKEKSQRRHHKKKRSQSKLMTGLALTVGLLIGGVILAAIYFLFR
jgi:cobalamin biosynthesis Mg chelatase CobN